MTRISRYQIRIHTENSTMRIEQVHPRLRIRQKPAKMQMETVMPTFTVDWDRVRSESGHAPSTEFAQKTRDHSYQDTLKAISKIVRKGNRAADIASGENVLVEISKEESRPEPVEFNVGTMPKSLPKIQWSRGSINVEWEAHEMTMDWEPRNMMPTISVDPYSIEIWLEEMPARRITLDASRMEPQNRPKFVPKI